MRRFAGDSRPGRLRSLSILACLAGITLPARAAEIPAQIRKSLEQNAAKLSTISLRWSYQLFDKGLKAQLSKDLLKGADDAALEKQFVDYKFKAGHYYFRKEYSQHLRDIDGKMGAVKRLSEEKSFDGERVYMYAATMDGQQPTTIGIFPKETTDVLFDNYFDTAGFRMPGVQADRAASVFRPKVLAMVDEGASLIAVEETTLEGRPCTRIALDVGSRFSMSGKQRHEMYLDPEAGCTLRRQDIKGSDGTLIVRVDFSDIRRLAEPEGPWLPLTCRSSYHQYKGLPGKPSKDVVVADEYHVESYSLADLPESTFALSYIRPGMVVGDATLPGADKTQSGFINYTVPANPSELDRVIRQSVVQQGAEQKGWSISRFLLLAVNGFLVVGVALFFARRRWRGHSRSNEGGPRPVPGPGTAE